MNGVDVTDIMIKILVSKEFKFNFFLRKKIDPKKKNKLKIKNIILIISNLKKVKGSRVIYQI